MRKAMIFTLLFVFSIGAPYLQAQDEEGVAEVGPVVIPDTETLTLSSSKGYEYLISVGLPQSYQASEEAYPVLYLLDSDITFATAIDFVRLLAPDELPELIVVGIGYSGENERDRDYVRDTETFLSFIGEELIPLIDSRYRTNTSDRAIEGFSAGGHFVYYVLASQLELFNRYIIVSAGLPQEFRQIITGTNNEEIDEAFRNRLLQHNVRLSISRGSRESQDLSSVIQARAYEGLELITFEIENGTHRGTLQPSLSKAILAVYCGDNNRPDQCGARVREGN